MSSEEKDEVFVDTVPEIDRCINTEIFNGTFSGATCIASVGGRLFHRGAYGMLGHEAKGKVALETVFDLGELTMPLATGLGAMVLASQTRLDLNASLERTLKIFKQEKFHDITIDMLLDHTSGMPSTRAYWEEVRDIEKEQKSTIVGTDKARELIQGRVGEMTLDASPGGKVIVSEVGFLSLGWIMEALVRLDLDIFLQREVYGPLGADHDLFFVRHTDPVAKRRFAKRQFIQGGMCPWREVTVQGEVADNNAWALGGVAGHAGLFGTVDGVWTLMHALWAAHSGAGRDFLGGSVRRFWTRSKRLRETTRTLAWDTPAVNNSVVGKRFSKNSVGHMDKGGCSAWVDLASDTIAVILTNRAHSTEENADARMEDFRKRVHDLIAKHADALPPDDKRPQGSKAFYSGPYGAGLPLNNPLRKPK